MPGNEVGDRVHNFFGQENLSQGQHHPQATDGNWPGLSNNLWVGNQRQVGSPVNSSLKSYNIQPGADSERGHGSPSLHVPHGLNFMQTNSRPEFGRVQSQSQQPSANGYMHGHQMFQTRQNEANFLGVDTESHKQNLTSRGLSTPESQGSGSEHAKKNSARLETSESPVGFNFFGGQQQMSGQHLSMMQSLPRQQQPRISDRQLQRQAMFTQVQEFQRQQQLQQLERQQLVMANQASSTGKQTAGNHSPALMNGVTINEASNNQWPPNVVAGNTNWLQQGAPPVMQGVASGHVLSHDQAQAPRLVGFVPQQADQSLYGVPISSSSGTPGSYPHFQMDKPAMQQISIGRNSFPGNQYAAFSGPVSMQDGSLASRQGFQVKSMVGPTAAQNLNSGFNLETLHRVNPQQRNQSMEDFRGRQELVALSEPSPEKAVEQVAPSQGVATLDPTEEKILFGSDDNIWDAFGRSTNLGMAGSSMLDGADVFGGLSSVQSGTWSALMQSAVAETSSVDGGLQEEWCGPTFRNPEAPVGAQQPSSVGDTNKQQSGWAGSNLHSSADLNSRPSPHFTDSHRPRTSGSFSSFQGFQQSGSKTLHERGDIFQTDSSHRFISQSPEQGSKWLDHNPLPQPPTDGSHNNYGTFTHSSGREINANSISGSWNRQERSSPHNNDNQPNNMSNGWKFSESVSTDGGNNLKSHGNQIFSRPAEGGDLKRGMREEVNRAAGMWKTDSAPNSNVEVAHPKYASPQINREGSNSSSGRAYQESQQNLANSHDFWAPVDSSVNSKGGEALGKNQHHLDKNHPILESSGNNCLDKRVVEMLNMENNNTKDNPSDTFYHNAYDHASTGVMKENVVSDAGISRHLPGSKQQSSGNAGRKPSGTRKFQYHPMGDLGINMEPSSGRKQVTNAQAMPQQVSGGFKSHDQGSFGQSKFMSHSDRSSMEIEKANIKGLDEPPAKSMLPGFAPSTSTPFDRSGNYDNTRNQAAAPSSQHMLELLHKVDQSREHGNATHFSTSDQNTSSEMPEVETSDGSVGHIQRSQSSVSQGFGLQLAPPSQRIPLADHALSSQSSSHAVLGSGRVHSEMGEKGPTWLASTAFVQSLPSSLELSQGELRKSLSGSSGAGNKAQPPQYHIQEGLSTSSEYGFPHSRSQRENHHMTAASGQVTASQSVNIPFDRLAFHPTQSGESFERTQASQSPLTSVPDKSESASQDNHTSAEASVLNIADQSRSRVDAPKIPESDAEPSVMSSMSHQGAVPKVLTNVWTSVPFQQPLVSAEPSKASSQTFKSQLQTSNHSVTTFHGSPKINEPDTRERGNGFSAFGVYSSNLQSSGPNEQPSEPITGQQVSPENIQTAKKTNVSQGKESTANNYFDASASNSAATQRDIEAFGRSLRPNSSSHQSYSLLNQVQAMRSAEIDGSDHSVKRLRGPDSGVETQQVTPQGEQQSSYGYNTMARDSSADHTPVPSGDSKMLSFAPKQVDPRLSNASSQDMFTFNRKNSQNFSGGSASSLRGEQSQVSPQMAPSWFDQYGTFKNGQILPVHDTLRATMKSMEQPTIAGKPGDLHAREQMEEPIATSDASTIPQGAALKPTSSDQLTPPHLLHSDAADESLTVDRPKKRKSATSELSPWHKELNKVSQRLQNMRAADIEWARATNRLPEKVEDESEMIEDGPPMFRSKKRLILTTQLVQQLLRPPPSTVLSADASSAFESVAYFTSRLSVGDACSAISCARNDTQTPSPPDRANHLPEKLKTLERVHRYLPKVVEDLVEKARKLENDLLRLDKRTSILDLRVETQDLEKFSVINRFAKFHGRAQGDGAEGSSSSDTSANAHRTCPQKYVTALPVPRNLPDRQLHKWGCRRRMNSRMSPLSSGDF